MSFFSLLLLLVIAAVCGSIGQSIAGYSLGGCIVSMVVGFIGALIGQWMVAEFNFPEFFVIHIGGKEFPLVWTIIGATIFSLTIGLLTRGRKKEAS